MVKSNSVWLCGDAPPDLFWLSLKLMMAVVAMAIISLLEKWGDRITQEPEMHMLVLCGLDEDYD